MAEPFRPEHAERRASFVLALPAPAAFELFTPEGERRWAQGWDPEYLHPRDGRLAEGMVFRTTIGAEDTVWSVARCEPGSYVRYVRCTHGSRIALVSVRCTPLAAHRCEVAVGYTFTGLSDAGNERIREMDDARFAEFIASWRSAIEAMLERRARAGADRPEFVPAPGDGQ